MTIAPRERHRIGRIGWLRAAVLGANDGIVSTASLMLGVATSHATHDSVLVAGVAGLVAGAMSMAAGEYVSVHSQADTEAAELLLEGAELQLDTAAEEAELAAIYVGRGLAPALAKQVAEQLMAHDAVGAHARDELGMTEAFSAYPLQAALASAGSFAVAGNRLCARVDSTPDHFGNFVAIPHHPRSTRGVGRWSGYGGGCCKSRVLGRARDGCNGRSGRAIRNSRLTVGGQVTI